MVLIIVFNFDCVLWAKQIGNNFDFRIARGSAECGVESGHSQTSGKAP